MTKLIFICGNSRSGTTLMARVIEKLPYHFKLEELHFYNELAHILDFTKDKEGKNKLFNEIYSRYKFGYFKSDNDISRIQYDGCATTTNEIFKDVLKYIMLENQSRVLIEQTPLNIKYLNEIKLDFPDSKIIIMIRDPRDVLLSQKLKWKRKFNGGDKIPWREAVRAFFNYNPILISDIWLNNYKGLTIDSNRLLVSYENLISFPKTELKKICAFLNVTYNEKMLSIKAEGSSTRSDSNETGFLSNNKEKWREGLTRSELIICVHVSQSIAQENGYKFEGDFSRVELVFYYFIWGIRLLLLAPLILILNKHRIVGLIKKLY